MQNEPPFVAVDFTDVFERDLSDLSKKYRHIRSDIQPIIEELEAGNFIGDQIRGTGLTVFKVRVINRDIKKGKSSGYRLIYLLENPRSVLLLTVYSKLDQKDIFSWQIRKMVKEYYEGTR